MSVRRVASILPVGILTSVLSWVLAIAVVAAAPAAAQDPILINFQPAGAPVPTGYLADTGASYGTQPDGATYGWLATADDQPIDASVATRDRGYFGDQRIDTFNHLQRGDCCPTGFVDEIYWQYALPNGTYEVTLAFGDQPSQTDGYDSQHQVSVEGTLLPSTPFQPTAQEEFLEATATVEVTDGVLTIRPTANGVNTKLNYADVVPASGGANQPPVLDPIATQTVEEGQSLTVPVAATDADDDPITLSASGLPAFVGFSDAGDGTGTLTATPPSGTAGSYAIEVAAADGQGGADSQTFALEVTAAPTAGAELYRLNVAGSAFTDASGTAWDADDPSLVSGSTSTSSTNFGSATDPIAGTTDDTLYLTRRFGADFTYDLPVPSGTYDVELHFAEIYQGLSANGDCPVGGDCTGARLFDVEAEGQLVLDNLDLYVEAGTATAHVETLSGVGVADGTLSLRFFLDANGADNAIVQGIVVREADGDAPAQPQVTSTIPADGAAGVDVATQVTAYVSLPTAGQGVDASTVNASTVTLYPTGSPTAEVPANYNTTGGADAFTLQPTAPLDAFTSYTYVVDGVKDEAGAAFPTYTMTFTTGAATTPGDGTVAFTKSQVASGAQYTSVVVGPDGKLYGLVNDGEIHRWTIEADGTLSGKETITALQDAEGGQRLAIGLAFDPDATAGALVAWVSHTTYGFGGMADWGGKISRLSGAALGTVEDYVVNLPRSAKDHVTNGIDFGPDGALYVNQGSNSAMGAPDGAWSNRPERKLTAAVLRVDVDALEAGGALPVDVKTTDGGSYDPYDASAPVKLFATGIRNMYDLVWHSNGNLYVPTNGSASGGNAPASVSGTVRPDGSPYAGPAVPALTNISTQPDLLFRIPAPTPGTGGDIASADGQWSWGYQYHGHPNPTRGEYVLNGGNPTGGADPLEVDKYPVGVDTDPDYAGIAYNFTFSKSPNGVIEYRSTAFGGALQGKILVVRYSGGDDIIVLSPGGTGGDISSADTGLDGLTGFNNPLDLTENVATGDLYVSEYGSGTITLVRPADPPADAPAIAAAPEEVVVSGFTASTKPDYTVDVVVSNEGAAPLNVSGAAVSGPDAGAFAVDPASFSLAAGESTTLTVAFSPSSTGPLEAALALASNDPATPSLTVPLYGLASSDFEGSDEPPLAQIVETLGYAIDVGFTSLASDGNSFPIGDEVLVDAFEKAGSGPVEIVPVARYAPAFPVPFGWYGAGGGGSPALNVVGTLSGDGSGTNPHHQMLFPPLEGGGTTFDAAEVSFDPGAGAFGLFAQSPDQVGYTEDAINAPTNAGSLHRTRIYPLKDRTGTAIPNTYLVGFEEAHNHDHNDYVFVVSNVTPAADTDGVLVASSSAVDFGTVQTGNAATAVVTLSNAGSSDISLTGASVTGDASFELVTAPLPSLVPAGGAVDLDLSFAPQGGGASTATLTVAHDGVDAPLTVALSGSGIEIGTEAVVRLNAGEGGAYTDSDGRTWAADQYVTGASTPGTKAFDVAGTDDDGLYLDYRFAEGPTDVGDPFGYAIPVADGAYVVNLHFAEIYHGVQTNDGLGARVFDVAIEGTEVLTDYDIVADVGPGTAVVKTVEATVSDGTLNVDFTSDVNNAIIAAIEVLPADTGPPAPVLAELVVSEGDASQALAFGTAAGATGGYDAGLDGALLPPIPPSPPARFAARFVCGPATNPDCSGDFAVHTDVRAPLASGGTAGAEDVRVWTVQTSRASGGALTLDWSGASLAEALPAGQLVLRDAASGGQAAFADMLAQTSLTVDNPNVETFEIVYAPQATRPVAAAAGWNLLGLPLEPAAGTAAAVFGADAPATDLFVFDGGTYQPAGTESVPLVTGAGFWAFYDAAPSLTVQGAPVSSVTWDLAPGWNLVSGPSCAVALSAASGDVGAMVPGTFYAYAAGSSYTEADAANPGAGYWVNATEAGTVTLSCAAAGEPVLATASGASASGASGSADDRRAGGGSGAALTRALARVHSAAARSDALVISDAAGRSQRLLLGGASGADRSGVPAAAFALPPLPPRGAFDARFEGGSGAASAEAGAGSRRMAGPEGRVVVRGAVGDRVRLRLHSPRPDARYQVETVDARGRAIESIWVEAARAANGAPVELSLAGAEALRVRSEGALPSGFAVQGTSPNPARAADATLRIDAPTGGEVSVALYDVLGREVLKAGRTVAAGPARALRLPTGRLAAGLYLYRVELRAADGRAFRGTGRLTVVR